MSQKFGPHLAEELHMAARRLLLLAALLATGLLGRAAGADPAASKGQIGFVEQRPANRWHLVTLEAGDPQNIITFFDLPGAHVRVWCASGWHDGVRRVAAGVGATGSVDRRASGGFDSSASALPHRHGNGAQEQHRDWFE